MTDQFTCMSEGMLQLETSLKEIRTILQDTYQDANAVRQEIDSKQEWCSKSRDTMSAFMDLLLQYHNALSNGEDAPLSEGVTCLEELQDHLSDFYSDWAEYNNLKGIL